MRTFLAFCLLSLLCAIGVFAQNPPGSYSYPQSSGGGGGTSLPNNVTNPSNPLTGGVTAAGNEICDGSLTIAGNSVTSGTNDPAWTQSMVTAGWTIFASNTCIDATSYTNQLPQTTIASLVSAHSITTTAAPTANTTSTSHVVWGPLEDTQIQAAATAAWGQNTGACGAMAGWAGFVLVSTNPFPPSLFKCNNQSTGNASTGAAFQGWGRSATRFGIVPNFNWAGAPTVNGVLTGFGGSNGFTWSQVGFTGFQQPGSNPASQACVVQNTVDSTFSSIFLLGYGPTLSNVAGFCSVIGVGATVDFWVTDDGMGSVGFYQNGGVFNANQFSMGNNHNQNYLTDGGTTYTNNSFYGGTDLGGEMFFCRAQNSACTWHSTNDDIYALVSSTVFAECLVASTCDITGLQQNVAPNSGWTLFYSPTGSTHWMVRKTFITAGSGAGADIWFATGSTSIFDDEGGNSFGCTAGQCVLPGTSPSSWRTILPTTTWINATPAAGLTNCASSASPATCRAFFNGSVVIAAAASSVVVDTTAVSANSQINITFDSSLGTKLGVTCNTTAQIPTVSARSAGVSFTISVASTFTTNPGCFNYEITN